MDHTNAEIVSATKRILRIIDDCDCSMYKEIIDKDLTFSEAKAKNDLLLGPEFQEFLLQKTASLSGTFRKSHLCTPSVRMLGIDNSIAVIAYSRVTQVCNEGKVDVVVTEETRVWEFKEAEGWKMVHLRHSIPQNA